MQAIIDILKDGKEVTLLFASYEAAQAFKDFVLTYVEESEAGNGYSAYWAPLNVGVDEIRISSENQDNYKIDLNKDYLDYMLQRVIEVRTLGEGATDPVPIAFTLKSDGIRFLVGKLPDRHVPEVGDVCRTLISQGAPFRRDMIVAEKYNNDVKLANFDDFDEQNQLKPGASLEVMKLSWVMKIKDNRPGNFDKATD